MWTNLGSGVITGLWSAVISVCRMSPGPASINTRGSEWRGPARSREFRGPDRLSWTGLLTHSELSPHLSSSPVIISRHPEYTLHTPHEPEPMFIPCSSASPIFHDNGCPQALDAESVLSNLHLTFPFSMYHHQSRTKTEDNYYLTNSSFLIGELYTCLLSSHWQIFWLIIIRIPGRRDIVVTS